MKRLAVITGALFAVLCLTLVAVWSARLFLLDWALKNYLASQGREASVTVAELTFDHLLLTDLRSDDISAKEVLVLFDPLDLVTGKLKEIRLTAPRAAVDLSGDEGGGETPPLPLLPPIHIQDGLLSLSTPQGPAEIGLDGRVTMDEESIAARLYLSADSPFGQYKGPLDATLSRRFEPRFVELDLSGDDLLYGGQGFGPCVVKLLIHQGAAEAKLFLEDPSNSLRLEAAAQSFLPLSGLSLELEGSLAGDSAFWTLAPQAGLSGKAHLSGQVTLPSLPASIPPPDGPATVLALLLANKATSGLTLSVEELTAPGAARPLKASLDLAQDAEGAVFEAGLGDRESATALTARGEVRPDGEAFHAEVSFNGRADLTDALLAAFLPAESSGLLSFEGKASGLLPATAPRALAEVAALAPSASVQLSAQDLGLPDLVEAAMASVQLALKTDDDGLELTIGEGAQASGQPAVRFLPPPLDPGQTLSLLLEAPLSLSLRQQAETYRLTSEGSLTLSQGETRLSLTGPLDAGFSSGFELESLSGNDLNADAAGLALQPGLLVKEATFRGDLAMHGAELDLAGTLEALTALDEMQGLSSEGLRFQGSLRASRGKDAIELSLPEGASLQLEAPLATPSGTLTLDGPLAIGPLSLRHAGELESLSGSFSLPGAKLAGGISATAAPGGEVVFSLSEGLLTADAKVPGITLPAQETEFKEPAIKAKLLFTNLPELAVPEGENLLSLSIPSMVRPQLNPASLSLQAVPSEEGLSLAGNLGLAGGAVVLPLKGSWRQEDGEVRARLGSTRITFSKSGLQPKAISPLLAALADTGGNVTVTSDLRLSKGRLRASGDYLLEDLSFTANGTKVRGLNGRIRIADLLAPRSDGVQTLTAESIDPALPLRDVTARFALEPAEGGGPLVLIEGVESRSDFGPVNITGGRFEPLTQEGGLNLSFPNLDLAQLTALLGVEGLSANGTLRGSLPIGLRKGVVVIDAGSLDNSAEGAIRYNSPTARQALAGGGESVTLMLDALENFQYQEFGVTLDKPNEEELTIGFTIEGKNPSVLDGYPFRFNINLSTNPISLLEALRVGSDIGNLLLRRQGTFPSSDP